jgi:DNA polymerase-3 subunit beta
MPKPDSTTELTREALKAALDLAMRATSTKGSLPILGNVCLRNQHQAGTLTITGTNLEIAITASVSGRVQADWDCTIPAKVFTDAVNSLTTDDVILEYHQRRHAVVVRAATCEFTLKGTDAQEFPAVTPLTTAPLASFVALTMLEELERVKPAMAEDEARPALCGVHFSSTGDGPLMLEAADGFHVHQSAISGFWPKCDFVVPGKAIAELCRMLKTDEEATLRLSTTTEGKATRAEFSCGTVTLACNLIDQPFPDLHAVIPTNNATTAKFSRGQMDASFKAADVVGREVAHTVRLNLKAASKETDQSLLEITATSTDYEHRNTLSGALDGPPLLIAVNGTFISDAVKACPGERVFIGLTAPTSPILIKSADAEQHPFLAVMMPMMIGR